MSKQYRFKDGVSKIFGYTTKYKEDITRKTVEFQVDDFTAEKLFALSDYLGTPTILSTPTGTNGCPTCGVDYAINIYARNVKFD